MRKSLSCKRKKKLPEVAKPNNANTFYFHTFIMNPLHLEWNTLENTVLHWKWGQTQT